MNEKPIRVAYQTLLYVWRLYYYHIKSTFFQWGAQIKYRIIMIQPEHTWIRLGDGTPLRPSICSKQSGTLFFHASIHGTVQRKMIVTETDLPTVVADWVEENRGSSSSRMLEAPPGAPMDSSSTTSSRTVTWDKLSQFRCNINWNSYNCNNAKVARVFALQ
jgi:hypothetical protein